MGANQKKTWSFGFRSASGIPSLWPDNGRVRGNSGQPGNRSIVLKTAFFHLPMSAETFVTICDIINTTPQSSWRDVFPQILTFSLYNRGNSPKPGIIPLLTVSRPRPKTPPSPSSLGSSSPSLAPSLLHSSTNCIILGKSTSLTSIFLPNLCNTWGNGDKRRNRNTGNVS